MLGYRNYTEYLHLNPDTAQSLIHAELTHLVTEKPYMHTYTHSIHFLFTIRHHLPKTNHEDMTQEIARDRTNIST